MSLLSKAGLLRRIRRGRETRAKLVESNLDKGIAFQIRATREQRELSQAELARSIGMGQNNISRLESPDYGKHTLSSLKRIAEALDVALIVRFVPFSQYVKWLSGTPYLDQGLRPEALAVESFDQEEDRSALDVDCDYWPVYNGGVMTGNPRPRPLLDTNPNGLAQPPVENTTSGQGFGRVMA
jgi:transcriptional regulator with XRE-family HTH domain